jgi:opacity protein-like surface antigen
MRDSGALHPSEKHRNVNPVTAMIDEEQEMPTTMWRWCSRGIIVLCASGLIACSAAQRDTRSSSRAPSSPTAPSAPSSPTASNPATTARRAQESPPASTVAKEQPFHPRAGVYLSASWVNTEIGGDFNDTVFFHTSDELFDVPEVRSGQGFGLVYGSMVNEGAVEFSYQRTRHNTHSGFVDIGNQQAAFHILEFNLKGYLLHSGRIRPHLLFGAGIPWISIANSKTDGSTFDDETFHGLSIGLGGGFDIYVSARIFIDARAVYRWSSFGTVDGMSLGETIGAHGPSYSVGMGVIF